MGLEQSRLQARSANLLADRLCGWLIGLPIFVVLTSGGLSLPESHFETEGIPLHSSFIALMILAKDVRITKSLALGLMVFFIYFVLSLLQDFSRALLALQSALFLFYFYVFRSLNPQRILVIARGTVSAVSIFVLLHLASIAFNFAAYEMLAPTEFWGLTIYQSHLTYPLVVIFALWISSTLKIKFFGQKFFIWLVLFVEALLMRRSSLGLMAAYLLLYRWRLALIFGVLLFAGFSIFLTEIFDFTERLTFTRQKAWVESSAVLLNLDTLLLGNGKNNYAHNYFLHTLSTHGLFYSCLLFSVVLFIICGFVKSVRFSINPVLFVVFLAITDWNVNANLYQPYYASVFSLSLVAIGNFYGVRRTSRNDFLENRVNDSVTLGRN